MKTLLAVFACIYVTTACTCIMQQPIDSFCRADFVSRVRVLSFRNPQNDTTGMHSHVYGIRNVHVYKRPANVTVLPSVVYTPSNGAVCGLSMNVGKEYLLSGMRQNDGTLHVYLCGQVTDEGYAGISEWKDVSQSLRRNLTTFDCDYR